MLVVEGLSKRYDGFELGPIDLSVGAEVLAVLGPSGCGKTTLLSLVAGIASPDGGSVWLDGRCLDGRPPERRGTGLVFQDGALFPHMTVRENVAYAAADSGRVDSLAATLEIADLLDRRASALSGGERQRVALARALAADPDALLLDEPLSSLDAPVRRRLREELRETVAALAVPVVYVTHDQQAAAALGDRVAVLRDGSLEQVAAPSTVLQQPATPFVASFTGSENVFEARVRAAEGDAVTLAVGGTSLRAHATVEPGRRVTACVRPSRVRLTESPSADDRTPTNVLEGTVAGRLNEGHHYRVTVDVGEGETRFAATVRPERFERLAPEPGAELRLAVPVDAVHVIE